MSYIIKGILGHQLPWTLVLLGVMIAIVLEMSGIPSLAFAVGVYLPLSSSTPIFVGGMIRWLVDRWLRRHKFKGHDLTADELVAEGDKSSGVLLASGYIAGSAITGIVIALMNLVPSLAAANDRITAWATAHNPFFAGPHADLLALIPFILICIFLYLVGRDVVLATRSRSPPSQSRALRGSLPDSRRSSSPNFRAAVYPRRSRWRPLTTQEAPPATPAAPCAATRLRFSSASSSSSALRRRRCGLGRVAVFRRAQADLQGRAEIAEPKRTRARASRPVTEENEIDERSAGGSQAGSHHRRGESHAPADAGDGDVRRPRPPR